MQKYTKKWRESLINPYEIEFENLVIDSIYNYPPAGNDVMECNGLYMGNSMDFFIKIERSKMADFNSEVDILNKLPSKISDSKIPKVLEYGIKDNIKYIVLSKVEGNKLSDILKNPSYSSLEFLKQYGEKLAEIHSLNVNTSIAKQRKVNDYPKSEHYEFDSWDKTIVDYLVKNKPEIEFDTFIHGDFHYGNVLWDKKEITGIIDWEYSGLGFKEQDIAWALILRSTQKFLYSIEEIKRFLEGYSKIGNYDGIKLQWCLINGYTHFYLMNKKNNDNIYLERLKNLINLIQNSPSL